MSVDAFHLFQLATQGFCCSQILIILGLEENGEDNPGLVRAMQGLCGGLGRSGGTCGALTGGVCLLSLKAGKGTAAESSDPNLGKMINEFLQWFDDQHSSRDCAAIIGTNLSENTAYPVKCGALVTATYEKVQEILANAAMEQIEE